MFTTKDVNNSDKLWNDFDRNISVTNKTGKTKLAIALASLLSALTMQSALATCSISTNDRYEYIQSIKLNGTTLSSGVVLEDNDVLELTPGYSGYAYRDHWSVWLDLNNDGDFSDSNELVFTTSSASNSTVSATLDIPSSTNVSSTAMRVLLHSDTINSDSCNFNGFGDSEDFSVNVGDDDDSGTGTGGGSSGDYQLSQTPRGGANEHILSVEFDRYEYSTGNNDGYADLTHKTFNISDGDSITLTPSSSWGTDWAVWIDSDQNGAFDSDEKVFFGSATRGKSVEGTLDLDGISSGTARMRIAMNGDGTADADGFKYGEIEDYTANVQSGDTGGGDTGGGDTGTDNSGDKNYGSHVKWEHDNVKVKIFRFEFTDVDLTWSKSRIESEMNEVADYFDNESYGRFDVTYEIYNEVILVNDRVSEWDDKSSNDWKDYYAEELISRGEDDYWNIDDNTIYIILSPQISDWGIKAGVNPGAIRVYDTGDQRSQAGGIAHEMGHAMGLHHAQGLDGKDTVFGVGDYESEFVGYGNFFSMMGNNAWDFGSFNLYYKNFFAAWNIEDSVPVVNSSGTYKIYAHDQGSMNGDIGIRLKAGNGDVTYWVEYRTEDGADSNGVLINTEGHFPDEDSRSFYYGTSFLLDMTPNTFPDDPNDEFDDFDDFIDGALVVGKSYTDKWNAFTITTKRTGGTLGTASAWIEVEVDMH
ncbi:MAG: GEVED domain-containing protein [Colwellia sp.]|nr:GEVED domain-containing protein [Colwellia sp.]